MIDRNIFKGREDERDCKCMNCGAEFREGEIRIVGCVEYCPSCGKHGWIVDDWLGKPSANVRKKQYWPENPAEGVENGF